MAEREGFEVDIYPSRNAWHAVRTDLWRESPHLWTQGRC